MSSSENPIHHCALEKWTAEEKVLSELLGISPKHSPTMLAKRKIFNKSYGLHLKGQILLPRNDNTNLNDNKKNNLIQNEQDLNRQLSKDTEMANKHMKKSQQARRYVNRNLPY